ncbi:MAG: YfbM family protein [Gemmataceae bacterium]|nr:YfbM family protein [Gemmataceae bacterium]
MSMIGNYRRITPDELAQLRANPSSIAEFLYPKAGPRPSADRRLDIDKAWHAIHFLLCGDTWEGQPPLVNAVLGGQPLGDVAVGYGPARYLTPDEVKETFDALDGIPTHELLEGFDPQALDDAEIYPQGWSRNSASSEDQEYIGGNYSSLVEFFRKAASSGDAMLEYLN